MKKYLIGGFVGAMIGGLTLHLFHKNQVVPLNADVHPISATVPDEADEVELSSLLGVYSSTITNLKLADDSEPPTKGYGPILPDDFHAIELDVLTPLQGITHKDIDRICINVPRPDGVNSDTIYAAEIYLTADARRALAPQLKQVDGHYVSVRILRTEFNLFQASATKAHLLAATADNKKTAPDFEMIIPVNTTVTALSLLRGLSDFEPCDSAYPLEILPGYKEHQKVWQEAVEYQKQNPDMYY